MKIFLLFLFILIAITFIVRNLLSSAKRNLFKDQAAWSGNDLKIRYSSPRYFSDSKKRVNYLKMIADESKNYLEDQSKKENDEIK